MLIATYVTSAAWHLPTRVSLSLQSRVEIGRLCRLRLLKDVQKMSLSREAEESPGPRDAGIGTLVGLACIRLLKSFGEGE